MTFYQSCWLLVLQLCMELKPNVRVHCMVQSATLKSKPQNESIIHLWQMCVRLPSPSIKKAFISLPFAAGKRVRIIWHTQFCKRSLRFFNSTLKVDSRIAGNKDCWKALKQNHHKWGNVKLKMLQPELIEVSGSRLAGKASWQFGVQEDSWIECEVSINVTDFHGVHTCLSS